MELQKKINTLAEVELKNPGKKICEKELKKINEAIMSLDKGLKLSNKSHSFLGRDNIDMFYWKEFVRNINEMIDQINRAGKTLEHEMGSQRDFSFHAATIQNFTYKATLQKGLLDMMDRIYQQYPHLQKVEAKDRKQSVSTP